jgi:hypothetical protein
MKLKEALDLIEADKKFRVHFEWIKGTTLHGDYFPDNNEDPLVTEEEAWELAKKFARATKGQTCNIYVIDAINYTPVPNYETKKIKNR